MVVDPASALRRPGRPRTFDIEKALDAALAVFPRAGLPRRLGRRTRRGHGADPRQHLQGLQGQAGAVPGRVRPLPGTTACRAAGRLDAERDGRGKLHAALLFYAASSHGVEGLRGCLVVGAAAELATLEPGVAGRTRAALRHVESMISDLIREGQADGSIPAAIEAVSAAFLLFCAVQGLRVAGKAGGSRADAVAAVEQAMRLVA